ncbi:hypothetical protein M404DRAFT_31897 [Pisolithus tinctorius Marx 270]|uniref:DUF4100 domain-containing protein n=1 Tax=Pisolithus tinctorius Marx 270 TaxID=870435 RepID=A0A0C3NRD0_PISTI|nr:hypothetical protein M404DRAFT_31897 [Pisolithus tinctorius Marx 270]
MAHYYAPNWANLKADLLKYFDADLSDERFFKRHLKSFALESRLQPIMTLQDFRAYNCGFICIGGWLKNKGRISVDEHNHYFWAGLSPVFCSLVESCLRLKDLNLDTSKPFAYADVCQSAEEVLHHDCFDADDLDFLGPRAAPNAPQPQNSTPHHSDVRDDSREAPTARKQDEVETLIKSLSRMSLSDPDYSLLYYRAIKMDPDAAKVLHAPSLCPAPAPAPTAASAAPVTTPPAQARPARRTITCYGCGVEGHGLDNCEAHIYHNGEETILQAYECTLAAAQPANVVCFVVHEDIEEESSAEIYELEDEPLVAAVDRSTKITKENRKAVFDSVLVPPHSHGKEKENQMPKPSSSASIPVPQKAPLAPVFVPVDVHAPAFNGTRDDAIMEDVSVPKPSEQAPDSAEKPKKSKPAATTSLSSSLSQSASSKAIVDQILLTPLTVSVGEVIGTSRDVSQHLQELMQFKRQPLMQQLIKSVTAVDGTPPVASYLALTSSPLITINLSCNGRRVTGVIDSGSTLNVIRSGIAQSVIRMPIDMSQTVNMRDAKGGILTLNGLVQDVPLFCGAARTWTNLFVAPDTNAGFDLLLGHPWALGNLVSIVERESGTFVVFGADSERPLEMCVTEGQLGTVADTLMATLEPAQPQESVDEGMMDVSAGTPH